jgi:hypothetical protein
VHVVGFIIRIYHDAGHLNVKHLSYIESELYILCMQELQFMSTHKRVIRFPCDYVSF